MGKGYLMLAFVAVAALIAADGTDSANVMMEAAHKKEVVDGDLNGAIKQYRAVVAKYAANRTVSAMALVHMAECYQKMGDAESRKIYERVLREYGDQKEAAAAAKARLGGSGEAGRQTKASILAKRLLCAECGNSEADFSSDGRLMVFTDWNSGDLATRDLSTGKVKRLMAKPGTWKDSDAYGEYPALSRDLRQIVYCWETDSRNSRPQLRIMPNEPDGKARVLVENPEYTYYKPTAWSPDGKSVLTFLFKRDKTSQLALVSLADGAVKVLKSLGWRLSGIDTRPAFSPDGMFIVYHALAANPSKSPADATYPKDQHINVLAADGSVETEVVKTSGINQHPVWTPDGKHILFISNRLGKSDLWSVAVLNGKAIASESLVSSQIGNVYGARMVGNSYYYTTSFPAEIVNIAELAPGGNNQSRLAHVTESFIGVRPTWSPDGKSIGFKRHRTGTQHEYDLVVRSLETGSERTYLTNLGTTGRNGPAWLHDGKSVIIAIVDHTKDLLQASVNLATGEFSAIPGGPSPSSGISPDDKTQYRSQDEAKDLGKHIVAVDLSSGQERPIFTLPGW